MSDPLGNLDSEERVFVLFYASWCPFSRDFLPIFEEFAKKNRCVKVIVDDNEDELCEKYKIEYYPTVILFKRGKAVKRIDAKPHVGLRKEELEEFGK
jgi:thiol-disulfide isomerase/thioredoxin